MKWTITLMPHDQVLVAPSHPVSDETAATVRRLVEEWISDGSEVRRLVGVFGEDAEVVDRRTPPIQEQLDRIEAKLDALAEGGS